MDKLTQAVYTLAIVFLVLFGVVHAYPNSNTNGVGIPLVKRHILYSRDGISGAKVANIEAIRAHVKQVDAKYKQGMINWQANTGELDLWPVQNSGNEATASQDGGVLDNILAAVVTTNSSGFQISSFLSSSSSSTWATTAAVQKIFNAEPLQDKVPVQTTEVTQAGPTQGYHRRRARHTRGGGKLRTRQSQPLMDVQNDLLWVGTVSIGSNGQTFLVDMDTGSADFWIPHVDCQADQCKNHKKYDAHASSSSQLQDDNTFKITYGDGSSSSGPVYTDSVSIAGVTADSQYFSAVTTVSDSFGKDPEDGILGMAFQAISELNQPPWFQNLVTQNKLQSPVFSFRLAKTGSELYIGGTNPAKFTGAIDWHPVTSHSYWLVAGQPMINGKPINAKVYNMAIDSGTTVIVAPVAEAKAFWKNIPGSAPYANAPSYYTFPCKSPPTVSFTFGNSNRTWTISPQDFNLGQVSSGSPNCVGAVVGQDVGVNAWILGDAFMKNVYSVFDMGQNRVGFAQPK